MKYMRVVQGLIWLLVFAVIAWTLAAGHATFLTIFSVLALSFLSASIGFSLGIGFMTPRPEEVTCIGGPMDGVHLPRPPGTENADAVVMQVADFPEGSYRLDGDRMIWEEDS